MTIMGEYFVPAEAPHTICRLGASTGHAVRNVAMCENADTAKALCDSLNRVLAYHTSHPMTTPKEKAILEMAKVL